MVYEETFFDLVDELDIEELKKDFNLNHLLILKEKNRYFNPNTLEIGDHFKILTDEANLSIDETYEYLNSKVEISLINTSEEKQNHDIFYKVNEEACKFYEGRLLEDETDFLGQRELNKYYVKKFRLGYAGEYGDLLYRHLKEKGYSDDVLLLSGLIRKNDKNEIYDTYRMRIMFPIFDEKSRIIGFGGRTVNGNNAKYINSMETPVFDKSRNMYGIHIAKDAIEYSKKDYIIACEGYMDVIAFHQQGYWNAVASLGTALTKEHVKLMKKYVNTVYLAYDSDLPGTCAAAKAIDLVESEGMTAKLINLKPWKDPDEFAKNEGREALRKRIENASEEAKWKVKARSLNQKSGKFPNDIIDLISKYMEEDME